MDKEKVILEIERIKSTLEYHFQKYKEYEYDSRKAPRKIDRSRASDNMFTYAKYIVNIPVYSVQQIPEQYVQRIPAQSVQLFRCIFCFKMDFVRFSFRL